MSVALTVAQSWLVLAAALLTVVAFAAVVLAVVDAVARRIRSERRAKGAELEVMPAADRDFSVRTKNGAAPSSRPAPRPQRK